MGHLSIVLLLLQNGASPDIRNIVSMHVIDSIWRNTDSGNFSTSLSKSQVQQLCSWQCWNNLLTLITVLFYLCQRGETALHMAARAGQMEVVRCLLRNGALVDAMARVSQRSLFPYYYFLFLLSNKHIFLCCIGHTASSALAFSPALL